MEGIDSVDGVLFADDTGEELRGVRFEREYATEPADLWSAITQPDRVARWLDEVTGDLRQGGRFQIHFDDGDTDFEIEQCEPPRSLVVRWLHAPDRVSRVSAQIEDAGDGRARLLLTHDLLTARQAPEYAAGWHIHLQTLAAQFDGSAGGDWAKYPAMRTAYQGQAEHI